MGHMQITMTTTTTRKNEIPQQKTMKLTSVLNSLSRPSYSLEYCAFLHNFAFYCCFEKFDCRKRQRNENVYCLWMIKKTRILSLNHMLDL
jgi:hypothetical protein